MKRMLSIGMIAFVLISGISIAPIQDNTFKWAETRCCCTDGINTAGNCEIENLSDVKVAIVYERINDARPKRTIEEQIQIFNETNIDLIFRASWRWRPLPNSCSELPPELREKCNESGYSFEQMQNMIQEIKRENPDTIIVGAVPAQRINKVMEFNEITGEIFDADQVWEMALDPAKWNITNLTKEEFQEAVGTYSFSGPDGWYPDITNTLFQELLLSWAKNQIDSGMDAIWIDLLYTQAGLLTRITGDINHLAVNESFEAASKIVDEIHNYGESKGKYVYVGTWSSSMHYPYMPPKLDFVTVSPGSQEILNKKLDEEKWDNAKEKIKESFGNVPIFAFIDWADDGAPLSVFSQDLSSEEQSEFLRMADEFFTSKGMVFTYPVHGGSIGENATILAYDEYAWYGSLAPEFQTYETIKELAENKSKGNPMVYVEKPGSYLYISDNELFPLKKAIIIGRITIDAEAYDEDGIDRVEFYVDDELKYVDEETPYEWLWDETIFGRHEIKAIAYDNEGNIAKDKIDTIIFNIGG